MAARPDPRRRPYLGYRAADLDTPFADLFQPDMAPLTHEVVQAVAAGPLPPPLLTPFAEARRLLATGVDRGGEQTETGFASGRGGELLVAVHTPMPGVAPSMWDWWFGWHGSDPRRYKLWHPRAHLWAGWADGDDAGRRGRERYVGRTSFVDEWIGPALARAAIRFVPPRTLGFEEAALADAEEQTVICARIGASDQPVDIGWLVHQVRRVEGGAEMRSRFWLGGPHVAARGGGRAAQAVLPRVARRVVRTDAAAAAALLVHCAQEMAHLATFLPELHERFGDE